MQPILTLKLSIPVEYFNIINDGMKLSIFLVSLHVLLHLVYGNRIPQKLGGLTGSFLNGDFLQLLLIIFLSILAYRLVFSNLIVLENTF